MNTPWVRSSAALPREGQPVEFVLDNRDVPFEGTYTRQNFRSRWTSYDIERVRAWRIAALLPDNPGQGAAKWCKGVALAPPFGRYASQHIGMSSTANQPEKYKLTRLDSR